MPYYTILDNTFVKGVHSITCFLPSAFSHGNGFSLQRGRLDKDVRCSSGKFLSAKWSWKNVSYMYVCVIYLCEIDVLKWFTILLNLEGERGNQSNIYDTDSFIDISWYH